MHLFHTNQPAVVLQRSTHIHMSPCLHCSVSAHKSMLLRYVCISHCIVCVCSVCQASSSQPLFLQFYCNCMTKLIQKALFLAQNIPFCLCTVPSCPVYSSLSKTLAVSCCSYPLPPPLCMLCNSWVWMCVCVATFCQRERERERDHLTL